MIKLRKPLGLFALGVTSLLMVACSGASASGDDAGNGNSQEPPASAPIVGGINNPSDHELVEAEAPIEGVEVLVLESFPPIYKLKITSGLPSGCAAFERIDVDRDGNTFNVTVVNTIPAPDVNVACTMIYGIIDNEVQLDDIDAGAEYTVIVNGETTTFTAQ